MPAITFYRQYRVDGGIRTAISIDDATAFHRFEGKSSEPDPALLWYVDVRCRGKSLPSDPDAARQWFVQHECLICDGLEALAQDIRAGIDLDVWPVSRAIVGAPRNVNLTIVCSATRRMEALALGDVLLDIAEHWNDRIEKLPRFHATTVGQTL